jgi:hypothetical protein
VTYQQYEYVSVPDKEYPQVLEDYSRKGWRLHTVWHSGSLVHTTWERETVERGWKKGYDE